MIKVIIYQQTNNTLPPCPPKQITRKIKAKQSLLPLVLIAMPRPHQPKLIGQMIHSYFIPTEIIWKEHAPLWMSITGTRRNCWAIRFDERGSHLKRMRFLWCRRCYSRTRTDEERVTYETLPELMNKEVERCWAVPNDDRVEVLSPS